MKSSSDTHLLLFDIDGTIISARGVGSRALQATMYEYYGVQASLRDIRLDGKTDPMIVREGLDRAGAAHLFSGALSPRFLGLYARELRRELAACQDYRILPGIQELLRYLERSDQFLVGLATGNSEIGARQKLDKGRLFASFKFGGFGCDSESRTEIVRRAISRGSEILGNRFSGKAIVIGDTPSDIRHGREAGARTVAVATGSFGLEELQSFSPDALLPSLESLEEVISTLLSL